MPTDRISLTDHSACDAVSGREHRVSRLAAISMIGLGSASCVSIEAVHAALPQYGALPGLAGSVLAVTGLLVLLRNQVRQSRAAAERRHRVERLAPYVPVMADGGNGAADLAAVLAPAGETAGEPVRRLTVVSPEAVARAHRRKTTCTGAAVTLFRHGPENEPKRAEGRGQRALYAAIRLGGEWGDDLDLSPRAMARLEADPFVQRLARIG